MMKNLNYKINFLCATVFFFFMGGNAIAQKNYTFYALDNTAQSHYLNPAFKPSANVYVSFPLIPMQSFGVSNSGFNMSHLLQKRSQDDSLQLSPDQVINKLGKRNFITIESYNEIFAFGFRVKKNYFQPIKRKFYLHQGFISTGSGRKWKVIFRGTSKF